MLWLLALAYLLLAVRVTARIDVSVSAETGTLSLCAGFSGIYLRLDGRLFPGKGLHFLPKCISFRQKSPLHAGARQTRSVLPYLSGVLHACSLERLDLWLSLADAAATAVAAGAVRTIMISVFGCRPGRRMNVNADFSGAHAFAYLHCIFSLQVGDIMFAVLRTAVKKTGERDSGGKASH